jgi:hypothetical protein
VKIVQNKPTYQCSSLLLLLLTVGKIGQTRDPCQDFSYPAQQFMRCNWVDGPWYKYCISINTYRWHHKWQIDEFWENILNVTTRELFNFSCKHKIQQILALTLTVTSVPDDKTHSYLPKHRSFLCPTLGTYPSKRIWQIISSSQGNCSNRRWMN